MLIGNDIFKMKWNCSDIFKISPHSLFGQKKFTEVNPDSQIVLVVPKLQFWRIYYSTKNSAQLYFLAPCKPVSKTVFYFPTGIVLLCASHFDFVLSWTNSEGWALNTAISSQKHRCILVISVISCVCVSSSWIKSLWYLIPSRCHQSYKRSAFLSFMGGIMNLMCS